MIVDAWSHTCKSHDIIPRYDMNSGNAEFGAKSAIFCPVWAKNVTDDLEQGKSEWFDSCDQPSNLAQIWSKSLIFFSPCDLEIWWMTSKNNRAPLLYYIKLCASFQIHQGIQAEVTAQKCSIRVKINNFLSCVTLKFDGRPWKTIGHLFYTTSSFVHHFNMFKVQFFVLCDLEIWWKT